MDQLEACVLVVQLQPPTRELPGDVNIFGLITLSLEHQSLVYVTTSP
jgi:hypothetical protein